MLEMYNLMLVSMESGRERFWGPTLATDSKNDQNRMVFQKIPLQQGFQYKWTPLYFSLSQCILDRKCFLH